MRHQTFLAPCFPEEMFGFARLKRSESVVLQLETVSARSWKNFRDSLQLSERFLDFLFFFGILCWGLC